MGKLGLKRKTNKRNQNPRFLVVSEGEVTEFHYLGAVKRLRRIPSADLVMLPPGPTSPREIVEKARDLRKDSSKSDAFDSVWCIFDVEAKISQKGRHGLAPALEMAKDNRILVALSNPCIEIWILLHDEDHQAWICSDKVQSRCAELKLIDKKHIVSPDKLLLHYSVARERAVSLDAKHDRDGRSDAQDRNPSSGVYKLVDALLKAFPPH